MISRTAWPLRNVWFFRTLHWPAMLGTLLAGAVLTGSLVVGDSLRGSLRERAERQRNGVDAAFLGSDFVEYDRKQPLPGESISLLLLKGTLLHEPPKGETKSIPRATIVGLDDAGWKFFGLDELAESATNAQPVLLSFRAAKELQAEVGSVVSVGLERRSAIPRSSLFSKKTLDDATAKLNATITTILPENHPANEFQLTPSPTQPLLIYAPLKLLQTTVKKPGKVNAILSRGAEARELTNRFAESLTLADYGLRVELPKPSTSGPRGYLSIESERLLFKPEFVATIRETAKKLNVACEPTIVSLANVVSAGSSAVRTNDSAEGVRLFAYSVVAGVNPLGSAPLGPFLPEGKSELADDEILLTDWADSPLRDLPLGSPITLTYFQADAADRGEKESSATFRLAGYLPMAGPAGDPNLAPPFPGITDKLSIGDWEEPFEMNKRRITRQDDRYWDEHKATPKAYINFAKAEELFGSRLGSVTSVRVAMPDQANADQFRETLQSALLKELDPAAAGFRFQSVVEELAAASQGGTDFGLLFLMFSGLLIFGAMLLTGLLFRLMIERRAKEIGLLSAVGWPVCTVRSALVREGLLVASVGAVGGVAVGVLYAQQMLKLLVALWPDQEVQNYLGLHIAWWSPLLGIVLTVLTAWLTIRLSLRGLLSLPVPQLLRGRAEPNEWAERRETTRSLLRRLWPALLMILGLATLAIGPTRINPDERAGAFFTGGLMILTAGLGFARQGLNRPNTGVLKSGGWQIAKLGVRNAARRSTRTLAMIALTAVATFLVVSVESFRRQTDAGFLERDGGSGGFRLVLETDVPLFQPLDTPDTLADLEERLELEFQKQVQRNPASPAVKVLLQTAMADLQGLNHVPIQVHGGDDASCLNLYQASQPRMLGVPEELIARGGFRFTQTLATTEAERENPWLLLNRPGEIVPVFAEQNTVFFMLKTTLGGTVPIRDENGRTIKVQIVGLLQDSVFQSELIMADRHFRRLYPSNAGYQLFLLDVPAEREQAVRERLSLALRANGALVRSSQEITDRFLAVVSAYLTMFQLLGGLGLLLSILGISIVILRNIRERNAELALLQALGWRKRALQILILGETLFMLFYGLGIGMLAAAAAVVPNLAFGGNLPWANAAYLGGATLAVGSVVALLAVVAVARQPIVPALRQE